MKKIVSFILTVFISCIAIAQETMTFQAEIANKNGTTLFINSAVPWMHAGREDYIKVLDKNGIYSEVKEFEGAPHSFCLYEPWFSPTIQYIDNFLTKVFNK